MVCLIKIEELKEILVRITNNYMCAGCVASPSGMIFDSAPILKWTRGKHIMEIER